MRVDADRSRVKRSREHVQASGSARSNCLLLPVTIEQPELIDYMLGVAGGCLAFNTCGLCGNC